MGQRRMEKTKVGLSDLEIFVPAPRMGLDTLVAHRIAEDPKFERRLKRAIEKTGQGAIRFPAPYEDSATLAAQASYSLLRRNPDSTRRLRYIGTGTETTVDQSKPVAAYLEGMLQNSGVDVPETMMTFQTQHACAGGTIAMMSIAGLLAGSSQDDSGLVVSSDIARYEAPSTAEITQGAGAVSLLVERDPKLVELDLDTQGLCSRDVDDFFRPIGSVTAKVKGAYSMQCYNEALEVAFEDHCKRRGTKPADVLSSTDMFVFHVPFKLMALGAFRRLVNSYTGLDGDELTDFVNERGFEQSLEPNTRVGNLYTASTFMALAFLLKERYQTFGRDIVGKSILMASYGSGNTMIILSGRVAPGAPEVIETWDLDTVFRNERDASFEEYETWLSAPHTAEKLHSLVNTAALPAEQFYLASIREDGYREYAFSGVKAGEKNLEWAATTTR
ncbi:MAG: hydroxymethylglutaryl-CoA synthase family protein [Spirochaetota bacterium]